MRNSFFVLSMMMLFACNNQEAHDRYMQKLIHDADSVQAAKKHEQFLADSAARADSIAFNPPTWEEDSAYWISLWENQNRLLQKADSANNR